LIIIKAQKEVRKMSYLPVAFDPRQQMLGTEYEIQYKRDIDLKNVELHHHDFFEIYYLVSGDVTYTIESKLHRVMPGDLLLISPHELHQLHICPNPSAYERFVLWVDPALIRRLSTPLTDLTRCFNPEGDGYRNQLRLDQEQRRQIFALMADLFEVQQRGGFGSDLMPGVLLTQLLVTINRLVESAPMQTESASSELVTRVVDYIAAHYGESLSLDALAEQFYVSKYHLSHEFQRQVGTSIHKYILKKRLLIAREALALGQKPTDVWIPCGFGDYTGFFRAFKAEYGTSPKDYARAQWQRRQEESVLS
jgi:AraC-like DNA-binding protein/mannose-6-phosphate isomerase-like protein (cupin superfamily)